MVFRLVHNKEAELVLTSSLQTYKMKNAEGYTRGDEDALGANDPPKMVPNSEMDNSLAYLSVT